MAITILDMLYEKNHSYVSVVKHWTSWSFFSESPPNKKEITSYHDEIGP